MSNLVLGAAIRDGVCDFDFASGSSWISLGAPWRGSPLDMFFCASDAVAGNLAQEFLFPALKAHYCDDEGNVLAAYASLTSGDAAFNNATSNGPIMSIAQTHVNRSICGTTPQGLANDTASAFMKYTAEVLNWSRGDGARQWPLPLQLFGQTRREQSAPP